MSSRTLTGLIAALGLSLAAPALAQSTMDASQLPTCSASITDHCMNRSESGMRGMHMAKGHHMMAKHHHKRHMMKHRKHHMKKHHKMHTMAKKPGMTHKM